MNDQLDEQQLAELASELLLRMVQDRMKVLENVDGVPDASCRVVYNTTEVEELANSIVRRLGPHSAVKTIADVMDIVLEEGLAKLNPKNANWEVALRERIVQRLLHPLAGFHFEVPASAGSPISIDLYIGGENQLQISYKELREDVYQLQLSGFTRTMAVEHARKVVEICLKSFLGISMAAGIADPFPLTDLAIPSATITNHDTSVVYQRMLDPIVGSQAARMRFHNPRDPDDLEARTSVGTSAARRLRFVCRVMSSDSLRAKELRRAAALLCDAGAQTDVGLTIALSFMSIEAVLLDSTDKSDVTARLKEAVAFRLGKTSEERKHFRKKIKKLYDARSKVVHTGDVPSDFDPEDVIRLAREVLRKEIEELPSNNEENPSPIIGLF